jgi:coenzyme F420 hydrogenase subunit beta
MPTEKPQWKELFSEVVATGLCTGCAACVVACPYDVLKYDDSDGVFRPYHVEEEGGPEDCTHGQRGCTLCTRACPRFRGWEQEADVHLFSRPRSPQEVAGIWRYVVLAKASQQEFAEAGQDGGVVSAMLVYMLEKGMIDGALVSFPSHKDGLPAARPGLARTREEVLAAAGSRYTYSANTLAYLEATAAKLERLALVGMSCQASIGAVASARKAGKMARRIAFSIGLLCSKTFDGSLFTALFRDRYGIDPENIAKINIKGVFQIWMRDGTYMEVPLKEGHEFTRQGCKMCPDFAAEHADVSVGGIGVFPDYTLCIVRTAAGQEVMDAMASEGWITTRDVGEDPKVMRVLERLSRQSRKRWPTFAASGPELVSASDA